MNTMNHGGAVAVGRVKRLLAEACSRKTSSESPQPQLNSCDVADENAGIGLDRETDLGSSNRT